MTHAGVHVHTCYILHLHHLHGPSRRAHAAHAAHAHHHSISSAQPVGSACHAAQITHLAAKRIAQGLPHGYVLRFCTRIAETATPAETATRHPPRRVYPPLPWTDTVYARPQATYTALAGLERQLHYAHPRPAADVWLNTRADISRRWPARVDYARPPPSSLLTTPPGNRREVPGKILWLAAVERFGLS
jgi:hypothetical protein